MLSLKKNIFFRILICALIVVLCVVMRIIDLSPRTSRFILDTKPIVFSPVFYDGDFIKAGTSAIFILPSSVDISYVNTYFIEQISGDVFPVLFGESSTATLLINKDGYYVFVALDKNGNEILLSPEISYSIGNSSSLGDETIVLL